MTTRNDLAMTRGAALLGRASTLQQKREVVEALLAVWLQAPGLRLGQLIVCATTGKDLFALEDDAFSAAMNAFADKVR